MGAPRKVKIALATAGAIAISATAVFAINWRDDATYYDINRLQLLEQWRD